jgi:hypothetical protein
LERAYRHLGFALIALPVVLLSGFHRPCFARLAAYGPPLTPAVHTYAALLAVWTGLLVLQPLAIRGRRFELHRRLGRFSYILVPLIAAFAAAMMVREYAESRADGASQAAALLGEYLSIGGLLLFSLFYLLAVARIRRGAVAGYMRYMVCAAISLLPAGIARALGYGFDVPQVTGQCVSFATIGLRLSALIVYDRRHGLPAQAYLVALPRYVAYYAGWLALGRPA